MMLLCVVSKHRSSCYHRLLILLVLLFPSWLLRTNIHSNRCPSESPQRSFLLCMIRHVRYEEENSAQLCQTKDFWRIGEGCNCSTYSRLLDIRPNDTLSSMITSTKNESSKWSTSYIPETTIMRRTMIQYKNKNGLEFVLNVAKCVHHHFDDSMYIAIDIDFIGLDRLQRNPEIISIEDDTIVRTEQDDNVLTLDSIKFDDQYVLQYISNQSISFVPRSLLRKKMIVNDDSLSFDVERIPYGITMIQADQVPYGPNPVLVCIVDTGAAIDHPDLNVSNIAGVNRKSNYDKTEILRWNVDQRGHGTHIAGTIAAQSGNSYGIRGVNDQIPLFITRGLNDHGEAYESDAVAAIRQCELAGAKVINLSLSGSKLSRPMKHILDRLYANNVMIVAASGNAGKRIPKYPAAYKKVVSVGAVDDNENIWYQSNHGPWLELTAPGVNTLSTGVLYDGRFGLTMYSGTSMAAPHVSGVAAVLWSHFPNCTVTQLRYAMAATTKQKNKNGCDPYYGYGIVQLKSAYDFLQSHPCHVNNDDDDDGTVQWGRKIRTGKCSIVLDHNTTPAVPDKFKIATSSTSSIDLKMIHQNIITGNFPIP
jgi:Subtilase family